MKKLLLLGVLSFCVYSITAQVSDLARIEFTYFPQDDSDNSFRRFRTFINVPLEVSEDAYFVPGIEYRNINYKLGDDLPFSVSELERYQSYTLRLGYTAKWPNDWRYAVQGGAIIASNFEDEIDGDDFIYEISAFFIKDKTGMDESNPSRKPWRLIFGINYSTTAGRPFPLPVINYYREFKEDWSYSLGVPKSNVKYKFNDKHSINVFATLDGFFANIDEDFEVSPDANNDGGLADTISMTTVLSGLGYEYGITKHLRFYIYAGHTIINDIRLRDENADDVFTINDTNNFYGRSGLKFKI